MLASDEDGAYGQTMRGHGESWAYPPVLPMRGRHTVRHCRVAKSGSAGRAGGHSMFPAHDIAWGGRGVALVHHITVRQSTACVHAQIHWCVLHGHGQPKRTIAQQNASLQTSLGHGREAIVAFGTSPPAHDHWLLMHVGLTGGHAFHSEPSASRR
jgi:hypothetical protein